MAGAKRTVWDLALEITGQDKGAKAALASIKANIKDVQDAGKNLSKDFKAFAGNASKLALGAVAGVAAAGTAVITMANSFATAGDQVAKTADSLGMAIEGYQKLKYAMTDSGVEAGEFDSAIQKMTNTINQGAAGNEAARKQLEGIGLDAAKLASMRPEQAFERIADYMQTLPDDAARANVAITLFGKTAGPRMAQAMKQGSAGIQALGAEAESLGVIFSESQARASEEYGNQLSRLGQAVTGMKNQFIGGAIGPLTEAFSTLRGALQDQMPMIQELGAKFGLWLGDMVARLPEIIEKIKEVAPNVWDNVTKVKDFVGGWKNLAIIIGTLMSLKTILSGVKVVMSAVTYAQTAYNAAVNISKSAIVAYKAAQTAAAAAGKGLTVVQWAMNAAMAANPIGLIIAAVAALIAIIVLVVKNWDKIKEAMGKVWEKAKEVFGKVKDFIVGVFGKIKDFVFGIFDGIKNFFSNLWEGIKNVVSKGFEGLKELFFKFHPLGIIIKNWDKITDFFKGVWEGVKNVFTNAWNGIKEGAGKAWSGIKDVAGKTWEGIKGAASKAGGFLKNNWKTIALGMVNPWAGGLKAMYDHNEKFRNFVDKSFGKIKEVAGAVWDKMPGGVKNVFSKVGKTISGVIDGIKGFFTGLWDAIKQGPSATFAYLKNAFFGLWEGIKGLGAKALEGLKKGFSNFKEAVSKNISAVGNFFKNVWSGTVNFVKGALQGMGNFFRTVFDGIKTAVGAVGNFFQNIWNGAVNFVKGIIDGFRSFFSGVFDTIRTVIGLFSDFFKNVFTDPVGAVKNLFFGIVDVFKGIFDSIKEKVQSFVSFFTDKFKIVGDVIGGVQNFLGGVGNAVSGAVGGVKNFVGGLFGHAEGGIFNTRHVAEIGEKGPEAVVPLNNSPNGFDIWKEAGMIGGYMKKAATESAGGATSSETPPALQAAASKISDGGGQTINIDLQMTNHFGASSPGGNAASQLQAAGQNIVDDLETRVKDILDNIARNNRRVGFA